jgi:hypothetical protein
MSYNLITIEDPTIKDYFKTSKEEIKVDKIIE